MNYSKFEKISPLFEFWASDQSPEQNQKRLLKANENNSAASLFINEPYKWEVLFQSVLIQIVRGDKDSLKAFSIILGTLSKQEQEKILHIIDKNFMLSSNIKEELLFIDRQKGTSKFNSIRFFRILFAIFTNPYNIDLRSERNHIYEKSGAFFLLIRRYLKLI